GLMTTAWPFVASLVLAWLLAAVWDRPISPLATGTGVWAITVLVGLVLRGVTGAGGEPGTVPVSFMLVAARRTPTPLAGWRISASAAAGGPSRPGRSRGAPAHRRPVSGLRTAR